MRIYRKHSLAGAIKQYSPKPFVEISEKQMEKLKSYSQILLMTVAIVGVTSLAVVMPGALAAIKIFCKLRKIKQLNHKENVRKVTKTFYYLKNQKYVDIIGNDNKFNIILTEKGRTEVEKLKFWTLIVPKPDHWDGKFWQVAADIPTKYRGRADLFRRKIKQLGLYSLQRTLWFFPFDLRKEIETISQNFDIDAFVTVMKIEILDPADEAIIKKYFKKRKLI